MKRRQINHYFVRTVVSALLILIAVVCTMLMELKHKSYEAVAPETTEKIAVVSTTSATTVQPTIPPTTTEQTNPVETTVATVAVDIPVTEPKPTEDEDMSQVEMMACVIYQEAGGDAVCDMCRYRVGDIVLNRVSDERFPNSIYGVLTQKNQYGKFSSTGIKWPSRASNPNEANAVERAYQVAMDIMNGVHSEVYGNGYIWQAGFEQGSEGFWCCGHYYGK